MPPKPWYKVRQKNGRPQNYITKTTFETYVAKFVENEERLRKVKVNYSKYDPYDF